jgi:hypothetical protein
VVLTGSGLKDPDAARRLAHAPERVPADATAVRDRVLAAAGR